MEKAIIVSSVSKKYKLYKSTKERLFDLITPKSFGEDFYALSNVDFEANVGEVVGFVGINGSGKSTLSNIIAGIVPETSGTVRVNGQVSLIAVAAGLKNDLTGRDNIELKLLMLGFNKNDIRELEEDIIEFSELGTFIDQPVKSYSSGMRSRLGFSISVNVDPDILIIDEALSVGDKAFAEKSLEKMKEFREDGKTMIFVSHSIGQMKKFCDKILWLEYGTVKEYGTVGEIIPKYEKFLKKWKKLSKNEREIYRENVLNNNSKLNEKLMAKIKIAKKDRYIEKPISRLGRFWPGESYIYKSPSNLLDRKSSTSFRKSVYYIKKSVSYNGELFYLISTQPSAIEGVIGWVKKANIATASHVLIDEDRKLFRIKGEGSAFDKPWGSEKNIIISSLKSYRDVLFEVDRTERVGKTLWYFGDLDGQKVWIHQKFVHTETIED